MRGITSGLIIGVAVGLLAGSAVGVAAQDETADPMAPGFVTGSIAQWRAVSAGTQRPEAGFVDIEDVTHAHVWEASDPRLAGDVTYRGHWHRYPAPASMQVEAATYELVNGAGRWLGQATALAGAGLGTGWDTVVFSGDGAYEGLTAYVVIDWSTDPGTFTGAIFPGEMPSFPALE